MPFRPVIFDGLTATPYVDTNRARPRLAWSLKATGMSAPGKTAVKADPKTETGRAA